jgi:hypothetical protein
MNTFGHKLHHLTHMLKLLVIGQLPKDIELTLEGFFEKIDILSPTQQTLEILNPPLFEQYDVIIAVADTKLLKIRLPQETIVITSKEDYGAFVDKINEVFALLVTPFDEDLLLYKIYALLSISKTDEILKAQEKLIKKYHKDAQEDGLDTFLDQYSGTIMFINDDLAESLQKLQDFELSTEILQNVSNNLLKLSEVFAEQKSLQSVCGIFDEFAVLLQTIELDKVDPTRFVAFDYLANIVEDLTIYIDELFIYKVVKDVKIFEDSLQNNIAYFESNLVKEEGGDEDDGVEFF